MKITTLYVYPIKSLRGMTLGSAELGPQGIRYDRRFMLFEVREDGARKKIQLSSHTHAALFEQKIRGDQVLVEYHAPPLREKDSPPSPQALELQAKTLEVPLEPGIEDLEPTRIDLHGSPTDAYRMGDRYDEWFSACFGHRTELIYLGDGRREVLGTMSPTAPSKTAPAPAASPPPAQGWMATFAYYLPAFALAWLSYLASYIPAWAPAAGRDPQWITFTDVAPFLVTSESSLHDVSARLPDGLAMDMYKFRPNIVVDGAGEAPFAEDYWGELSLPGGGARLLLTSNCARCTSLNVDYQTGRTAEGELGSVLKKLMKDRRVDKGVKWSPIFGRYAFFSSDRDTVTVKIGDKIEVTQRNKDRTMWDWPGL